MLSGFTIAREAVRLNYPVRACVESLRAICDEVVYAYDPRIEEDDALAKQMKEDYDLVLLESPWNMDNFDKGREIGIQTDIAMNACRGDWQMYCQLDEAFHEDDGPRIRELISSAPSDVHGIDTLRVYFFGNLHTIRKDWSVQITRITRKGTHRYGHFDGMNCEPLTPGHHLMPEDPGLWMFHYSRIGKAEDISRRVRANDRFHHNPDTLLTEEELPEYDFKTRQWDNFSKTEDAPPEVQTEFVNYQGTHPKPFADLYAEYK
jgi:hypothetical protein